MSAENAPSTTEPTLSAAERVQREQMMMNGVGGDVDESRASQIMGALTIPETAPDDNRDVAAAEAARRQLERDEATKRILQKHSIEAQAARQGWTDERIRDALAGIAVK